MSILKEILEQRDGLHSELEQITRTVEAESRDLNESEQERSAELLAQIDQLDGRIAEETRSAERAAQLARARQVVNGEAHLRDDGTGSNAKVTGEPLVYGPDSPNSWWADQIALSTRSPMDGIRQGAESRLAQYSHQVEREIALDSKIGKRAEKQFRDSPDLRPAGASDRMLAEARSRGSVALDAKELRTGITTGGGATATAASGGAAFVSPVILALDDYAPYREYGRAFADQTNRQPLPSYGMEVYLPHVTGPAGVLTQTEAGSVNETDPTFGYLSAGLITLAGQVTASQQQLDRTGPGFAFDKMVFAQLERDYAPKWDAYVLSQVLAVATSQSWGGNAGAFDLSVASGAGGFYGQVSKAKASIRTTEGTVLNPSHIFLQPARWEFIAAWADAQGRALVVPDYAGPFNALANSGDGRGVIEGVTGARFNGLPVFTDANIPNLGTTSTDQAIVADMSEVWTFEGEAVHRVLPQTLGGNLQTILQRYSYVACLIRYPAGVVSINGAGMAAPTYTD